MYGDQPQPTGGYGEPYRANPKNGLGIAALVVAVVAALTFWVPVLGLVLGVVGIVLAVVALRRVRKGVANNRGVGLAALIVSILAAVAGLVVTALAAWVLWFAADNSQDLQACLDSATTQTQIDACSQQFGDDLLGELGVQTS